MTGDRRSTRRSRRPEDTQAHAPPSSAHFYPRDLARAVRTRLRADEDPTVPPLPVLAELMETLFFASLRTEESQPVIINVTWIDPRSPDPEPPRRIASDRWTTTRLVTPLRLTVANLVKLSAAADPRASSLAVHHDGPHLRLWGFVDQPQSHDPLGQGSTPRDRPGLFQASVPGPAQITVFSGSELLASLAHGQLAHTFHDVLRRGLVRRLLEPFVERFVARVRRSVGPLPTDESDRTDEALRTLWLDTLARVLQGVQAYRHGGAILISDRRASGLNVKHELSYARLAAALERLATSRIRRAHRRDSTWKQYLLEDSTDELPADYYVEEELAADAEAQGLSELAGCVRFVASLSRPDGLVLLDGELVVGGFGVEITEPVEPPDVFVAGDPEGSTEHARLGDYNHFGTRHRSMMRYCMKHNGSVGFVVSQDGTIRAVARDGVRLLIWDTVQLYAQPS
jgi:hypothetical protein